MTTRSIVLVTDETTRAELAVTLGLLNADAKAIRRRGYVGVYGSDYARKHAQIDALLTDWQAAST